MLHAHSCIHDCIKGITEPNASICLKLSYTISNIPVYVTCTRIWRANNYIYKNLHKCWDKMFKIPCFWQCMHAHMHRAMCVREKESKRGNACNHIAFITSGISGTTLQIVIVLKANMQRYSHFVPLQNNWRIHRNYDQSIWYESFMNLFFVEKIKLNSNCQLP